MHAWRIYAAVIVPLLCLLWGQLRFTAEQERLHVDLHHEWTRLEHALAREAGPARRRSITVQTAIRVQRRTEHFADAAFRTLLYFGLFPLVLGMSLLAAHHLQRPPPPGR